MCDTRKRKCKTVYCNIYIHRRLQKTREREDQKGREREIKREKEKETQLQPLLIFRRVSTARNLHSRGIFIARKAIHPPLWCRRTLLHPTMTRNVRGGTHPPWPSSTSTQPGSIDFSLSYSSADRRLLCIHAYSRRLPHHGLRSSFRQVLSSFNFLSISTAFSHNFYWFFNGQVPYYRMISKNYFDLKCLRFRGFAFVGGLLDFYTDFRSMAIWLSVCSFFCFLFVFIIIIIFSFLLDLMELEKSIVEQTE